MQVPLLSGGFTVGNCCAGGVKVYFNFLGTPPGQFVAVDTYGLPLWWDVQSAICINTG